MENTEDSLTEAPVINLVPAAMGKRFVNYFIDIIVFSVFLSILLVMLAPVSPLAHRLSTLKPETVNLMDQFLLSFIYGLYISVTETVLKGKTIGKYITATRVVDENGLPVSSQAAFARGLIRIIPFEQLSAITFDFSAPRPWHDRWSRTFVVDENKSILPKS